MSNFPHVRIALERHGFGQVYIDDVKIDGVRKVSFEAECDELNTVTLTLVAGVSYTGPAQVNVIEDRKGETIDPNTPDMTHLGMFD